MTKRILFATDVPFWQMSTGAEQRIFSLYRFLRHNGCPCGVFFLGHLNGADHALIERHDLDVYACSSDQPPGKLMDRIRWYADASIHQARSWLKPTYHDSALVEGPHSLTLDDFKWAWAVTRIGEVVDSFRPGAIIFEYVKLGYLIDGLTAEQRKQIVCLVDTHDVLHLRAEQFQAHGFPHWLKIDRAEEGSVLKRFDAVIAIQENEARLFREMTDSRVRVITAGHAVDAEDEAATSEEREQTPDKITVGYIGSKNFSNWQAIREFLLCAWPTVLERNKSVCELVIAGGICEWFDAEPELQHPPDGGEAANPFQHFSPTDLENVQLLGPIESIRDFYNRIDVVINPVQFGTGLKIKNAESLRFGKLLITTLNGFDGMPEATRLACMVVENVNEMGLAINSICNDLNSIRPMQQLAFQLAQTEFSESQAYSELKRFLEL